MLGSKLRNMGRVSVVENEEMTEKQKHHIFFEDLKTSIHAHVQLRGYDEQFQSVARLIYTSVLHTRLTNEVESFFAELFFIQFGTSGLCVCGSVYCLAFVWTKINNIRRSL